MKITVKTCKQLVECDPYCRIVGPSSRRDFLANAALAGAGLAVGASVMGCTGDQP